MNIEKNKRYFDLKKPDNLFEKRQRNSGIKKMVIGIIIAILMIVAKNKNWLDMIIDIVTDLFHGWGIFILNLVWIIPILTGIVSILMAKRKMEKREREYQEKYVSDEEYDKECFSFMDNIKQEALSELGLDEDQVKDADPIVFSSYNLKEFTRAKKGADGYWRTDSVGCTYVCFTLEALHCYNVNYNTILDKKTTTTDVYFYGDIVSLSTGSELIKMPNEDVSDENVSDDKNKADKTEKTESTRYDYFQIKTAGSYSFSIGLRDKEKAMVSINAMKSMIQERKK